ncbi:MAG: tagatose 1,6-diphosphate aldolase [Aggregatilineales bacterium]
MGKQIALTPGRWRALKACSTPESVFTILAFDQRGTYRRMLPEGASYSDAVQTKREIVKTLAPLASAVLLDAEYGMPAALEMPGSTGLLMALEESGYSGDATYRQVAFNPDWTVDKISRIGADAVKLLVYYHPASGELATQIEVVIKQVADEAHRYDLPVFVEPLSYSLDPAIAKDSAVFAGTRASIVIETARRLSALGIDVLKLEFPIDVAFEPEHYVWRTACESVSAVCQVPWVLLSAGVDFPTFLEQTRIACESGASGFLAGRAIWKEAVQMVGDARTSFLADIAKRRLQELNAAVKAARPWTDFYRAPTCEEDWYRSY